MTKHFTILENNPEVLKLLASNLGLAPTISFHDIYTLSPPCLPRGTKPAVALLAIIPLTPAWAADRLVEDTTYQTPANPPVLWFKQTIPDACGSIGLLHCALNGACADQVLSGSTLARIRDMAIPLGTAERAQMLYDNQEFEDAHQSVATLGDTQAPEIGDPRHAGRHFVAFVKAAGRLWELEGSRKGPIDRGALAEDDDVLSPRALELGLGRIIKLEQESGDGNVNFSCVALVKDDAV